MQPSLRTTGGGEKRKKFKSPNCLFEESGLKKERRDGSSTHKDEGKKERNLESSQKRSLRAQFAERGRERGGGGSASLSYKC